MGEDRREEFAGCCTDGKCTDQTCMILPREKTCGACAHFARCKAFGFTEGERSISCDFFPRRFLEKKP